MLCKFTIRPFFVMIKIKEIASNCSVQHYAVAAECVRMCKLR